jgi:acyl-CoA thioester hydrolase
MKISRTKVEVRYAETDQMGVVHHANYLVWLELGRTKLIEELGFSYAKMEEEGIVAPVLNVNIHYKKAVKYGQTATIDTWIEQYEGLRVIYGYKIMNADGDICITGTTTHTCVKKDNFRPVLLRKHFPDWHEAYEKAKKQGVSKP